MIAGENRPYLNHGVCLGNCNDIEMKHSDVEIACCEDEEDILLEWSAIIKRERPDVIIGYNIFGFDYKFLLERAEENGCYAEFRSLGKNSVEGSSHKHRVCKREEKTLKIASGSHELIYINIDGIIQIDLYNYFRRGVNLSSYKLQDVASHYIGDIVIDAERRVKEDDSESKTEVVQKTTTLIKSQNLMGLEEDNYVIFEIIGHSLDAYEGGKKYKVINVNEITGEFVVEGDIIMPNGGKMRWGLGKDDVSPSELFHAFSEQGTDEDRTIIAKYCFQDCNLVHNLMRKNDILTGMSEIAAICYVPIDYIIMRGEGIKLLSFISKKCSEINTLMPVLEKKNDGGYEGAICLPPKCGFYSDNPVAVVDYASLYPSSMISENISHDSKVTTKEFDLTGSLIKEGGDEKFNNLPGFKYVDIEYDMYEYKAKVGKTKLEKEKVGTKICRYAQFPNNKKAIMPRILTELLAGRKHTRELIKYKDVTRKDGSVISGLLTSKDDHYIIKNNKDIFTIPKEDVVDVGDTYNDFMKNVLNQRQLGFKVTANSLYGQCGARTSAFYDKDIAASTTATGRKLLIYSKEIITRVYNNITCDTKYGKVVCKGEVIYGDTDSCFFIFNPRNEDGIRFKGKEALDITIELAIRAGKLASKFLKLPHDLEYEKTFSPFLLLSKKRYVGILYEHDINKGKEKSMGIVLKRRDNADVVKDIYGGVINILMKEGNIQKSVKFTRNFLQKIIDGNVDMKKLIITKALRSWYKIPESIAHKVLADRMGERDVGNKPAVGSRIPYVYIQTKNKVKLQGDRIEHPDYIVKHDLKPDYGFYITNQIMKPLQQLFSLILETIPEYNNTGMLKMQISTIKRKHGNDLEKIDKEEMKLRNNEVKKLIFSKYLNICNNKKNNNSTIENFFKYK
jgi:DNA polymerase elongation subunit (family B)